MRRSVALSILLHLLGFAMVLLRLPSLRSPQDPAKSVLVELTQGEPHTQSRARGGEAHSALKRRLRLSDLALPLDRPAPQSADADRPADGNRGQRTGDSIVGTLEADTRHSPLLAYLYEQIDGQLRYPNELKAAGFSGHVSAKVVFSAEGDWLEDASEIRSSSPYLKVLVARTLRAAFKQPVPPRKLRQAGRFNIQCSFAFEITEHDDARVIQSRRRRVGGDLAFYRNWQRSVLQWDLGPLHGLGPFVGLDVVWVPRKIVELLSNKAKIDPLDSYRTDPQW